MGAIAAKREQKGKKPAKAVAATKMAAESGAQPEESRSSSPVAAAACANCGDTGRNRRRQFSEQAWTVLLLWNEISPLVVDKPICADCYEELREILIDRADEVEAAMQQSDKVARIRERLGTLAS